MWKTEAVVFSERVYAEEERKMRQAKNLDNAVREYGGVASQECVQGNC